jgi:hypothetical protein
MGMSSGACYHRRSGGFLSSLVCGFSKKRAMQCYMSISDAVIRLRDGTFAQLPRLLLVVEAKAAFRKEQRRPPEDGRPPKKVQLNRKPKPLSVDFGPWRTEAAEQIRDAALAGKLKVYLAPENGTEYPACAKDWGEPELLAPDVLRLIILVRGGLPDHPLHVRSAPRGSAIDRSLLMRVKTCALLLKRTEFDAWYRDEKLKRKWPSQKESKSPHPGRPRTNEVWTNRIKNFVDANRWAAQQSIVALKSMLAASEDEAPPSDDTLARIVDRIFQEMGDSRFRRKKRRPSRKTPSS